MHSFLTQISLAKKKYKYNPDSLNYEEVELTFIDKLKKISYYFVAAIVFSVILLALSYNQVKHYIEKDILKENQLVHSEIKKFNTDLNEIFIVLEDIQNRDDKIYRSIFNTDPYPEYKRKLGTGGNPMKYKKFEGLKHEDLIIEISKKIETIESKLVAQSRSFDEVISLTKNKEKMLRSIPSIQPISNKDLTRIASGFGYRMHPIYKILKMHAGIDFTAPTGTEIYSTGDGVVEKCGWMSGYGNCVVIDHGYDYKTRYAHSSKLNCKKGQKIKRGDVIAFVGSTGLSTGPHLHYEVLKNNKAINPANYFFKDLSPEEYDKVIEISSRPTQSM